MKTVAVYSTPAEAHVALSRLMSAGIDAVVRDEFTITFNWLISNAIGGVKIEVVEEDETEAREILALPPMEEGMLRCPHCGSPDTHVRVMSILGAMCVFLNLPIPIRRATVDCRTCRKTHSVEISGRKG